MSVLDSVESHLPRRYQMSCEISIRTMCPLPRLRTAALLLLATALCTLIDLQAAVAQALPSQFLGSAVYVHFDNQSASGFMVCHAYTEKLCHVFLITNRHAIPPEGRRANIHVRVTKRNSATSEIKDMAVPVVGADGKYLSTIRVNPRFDVVAIKITQNLKDNSADCCFVDTNLFATREVVAKEKLTLGDEIFLLGYPAGIYEEKNTSPILRQGVIATDPKEDFSVNQNLQREFRLPPSIPGFLIDANVFPGSSGSMVILKPQLFTQPAEGVVEARGRTPFYVLGVVFGSLPITDSAIGAKQRMGLGIVLSADTILDTIKLFDPHL